MKSSFTFILLLTLSMVSEAARLDDVKILSSKVGTQKVELKLQTKGSALDSHFFLDIIQADPEAFQKVLIVMNKLQQKDKYRLDLEIPSFSPSPAGSFYQSTGIQFFGSPKALDKNKKGNK